MKNLLLVIPLIMALCTNAQTQGQMDDTADSAYKKADWTLNIIYKEILKEYASDTIFIKNLKISQKIWEQFKDAELNMKFPDKPGVYYGSVLPMCVGYYLADLTNDRIKTLKEWIEGIEEGDACMGSVKMKQSESIDKNKDYFFEPDTSVITGTLKVEMYYGKPNYGEDTATDQKEHPYIFYPDDTINVIQKSKSAQEEGINVTTKNIIKFQLSSKINLDRFINKKIKLTGTFYGGITGHDHTDVLMRVTKFEKL